MPNPDSTPSLRVLARGLRRRCPRCGGGRLFVGWYQLAEACDQCALKYEPLEGNSYWFMYYSTAGFTGLIIIAMLLIQPENIWLARAIVLVAAVLFIVLTLPYRKGLALAVDYLTERKAQTSHRPGEDSPNPD